MADKNVPIKLVIQEPSTEIREMLFEESKVIKIGRGARKGIDVPLEDPSVGRVHAVINIRKETDVNVVDMGASSTLINGKAAGARGKLSNGDELQVGQTIIHIYIGDAALQETATAQVDEVALAGPSGVEDALVALNADMSGLPGFSLDGSQLLGGDPTGSHDILEVDDDLILDSTGDDLLYASDSPTSASPAFSDSPTTASPTFSDADVQAHAYPSSPADSSPNSTPAMPDGMPSNPFGQGLYPGHYEFNETYGVLGPAPTPLPERFSGPSMEVLLDVVQRINQEVWAVYPNQI
ncbi:MAG: FHA domain-containing protein [Myxococcales bacterium]|nr:FHA domain-containing protein [Myxococcales bacterium]MCB9644227.1 FHA domain-containing protein [Myxococcales bacterium]